MTEHLILGEDGRLKFGVYNSNSRDYIGNIAQRIYSLMSISEYTLGYATLGELPELESVEKVLSVSHVYRLDYPLINAVDKSLPNMITESRSDLVFTGFLTNFRSKVINNLSAKYDVQFFEPVDDDQKRKQNLLSGKVALNIPQTEDWPWVSPMRVIYCLSNGIPCVHIGEGDGTEFFKRVLSWVTIDEALESPVAVHERQLAAYNDIELEVGRFLSLISVWDMMEAGQEE